MSKRQRPGAVRDAILGYFEDSDAEDASVAEVLAGVRERLGPEIPASSVRSYLRLNTPAMFTRTARGRYALAIPR